MRKATLVVMVVRNGWRCRRRSRTGWLKKVGMRTVGRTARDLPDAGLKALFVHACWVMAAKFLACGNMMEL